MPQANPICRASGIATYASLLALFSRDGSPADIAAAKSAGPIDSVDRCVGCHLGRLYRRAEAGDVEHPTANGQQFFIFTARRAGVKDYGVFAGG